MNRPAFGIRRQIHDFPRYLLFFVIVFRRLTAEVIGIISSMFACCCYFEFCTSGPRYRGVRTLDP